VGDVPNWATNVCAAASMFCQYPARMAIAAAVLAGLWLVIKFASAVSN